MSIRSASLVVLLADRQTDRHGALKEELIRHNKLCQKDFSYTNYVKSVWFRIRVFCDETSYRVAKLLVNIYQSTRRNILVDLNVNQYLARTAKSLEFITFALGFLSFCEVTSLLTNCCKAQWLAAGQRTAFTKPRSLSIETLLLSPTLRSPAKLVKQKADNYAASCYIKASRREDASTKADASKWLVSEQSSGPFSDSPTVWPSGVKFRIRVG